MQQHIDSPHPFPTAKDVAPAPASAPSGSETANQKYDGTDASGSRIREQMERAKQSVSNALTTAQDRSVAMTDSLAHRIQQRPYRSVAIAAIAGFALGLVCLTARRSSNDSNLRALLSRFHW